MNQEQPVWVRKPVAPPPDVAYAHKLGRGMLVKEQVQELVKAINRAYVETKQKMTYLAQHQARAEMNRIFGYGNWDVDAGEPILVYEEQRPGTGNNANKTYWYAGYRIRVTVTIRDLWGMPLASYTGVHFEENAPQPNRGEAHALAMTSVDSYALRRALINLGDRFGLGLYNGGSTEPHGQYTIQLEPGVTFNWEQAGQQQPAAAAPVQQPSHETIQVEPAAQASEGGQQGFQQSPQMENFQNVQQGMQAAREAERAGLSPEMAARMQGQMKVDQQQVADATMTSHQQAEQDR